MRTAPAVVTLLCTLSVSPVTFGRTCGEAISRVGQASHTLTLKPRTRESMFYFRTGHFVVLVTPQSVEGLLAKWVREGYYARDKVLLGAIRRDLPLQVDSDLFRYVLTDSQYLQRLEFIVADLLQSGDATVIDLWELTGKNDTVSHVTMVTANERVEAREFCSPNGDLLLDVTDRIFD